MLTNPPCSHSQLVVKSDKTIHNSDNCSVVGNVTPLKRPVHISYFLPDAVSGIKRASISAIDKEAL